MPVTFAQKLERMPHYEAGLAQGAARARYGVADVAKLASNESPWGPHPAVAEAIAAAAAGLNRYPEQSSPTLRRRIAEQAAQRFGDGGGVARHDPPRLRPVHQGIADVILLSACGFRE